MGLPFREAVQFWLLSRQFDFNGRILAQAIATTFSTRGTPLQPEPVCLTSAFAEDMTKATQWRGFIRKNRLAEIPKDFGEVIAAIEVFLKPIAESLSTKVPFQATWHAPGPWI